MHIPPLTQNQKLVLSFLASTAGAAAATGIAAIAQAYTVQGPDIPVLINVGLIAFGAFFGPALYNFVPGHVQQVLSAAVDTSEMLRNSLQQAQQTHAALTQTVQVLAQKAQQQAQAVAPVQVTPAQPVANTNVASGSVPLNFPANSNSWMLDQPTATTTAVQSKPVPPPIKLVVTPPVDIASQDTQYQSVALPPDLHFGDSGVIPSVKQ